MVFWLADSTPTSMNLNPASFISLNGTTFSEIGLMLAPNIIFLFLLDRIIFSQNSCNHATIGSVPASSNISLCPILMQSSISESTWSTERTPLCSPACSLSVSTQNEQRPYQQRFDDRR